MAIDSRIVERELSRLPFWKELGPEEKRAMQERTVLKSFAKNQAVSGNDASCMGMVLVLSGGLRVSLLSDEGREVTLFRVLERESCVTTASCVIHQISFDTAITAVDDSVLLVIPSSVFLRLAELNVHVRAFMFELETERFSQAIWVMQQILFKGFDQRLASFLLARCEESGCARLEMTQAEIAREVNSSREVVARMLGRFAAEGLVELERGCVLLKNPAGLRALA